MKCAECAREVDTSTAVSVEDKTFCDNLCRVVYQKKQNTDTTIKVLQKSNRKMNMNPTLIKTKTMNKICFAIGSLILIGLGVWAILSPDLMDGNNAEDIKGRHQFIKTVIMYVWGIPGGVIFVFIGLLSFKVNVFQKK